MADLQVLHAGGSGEQWRKLQAATNKRLRARDLDGYTVDEDGVGGPRTMAAIRKAGWALGAQLSTLNHMTKTGAVPVGLQQMILNPGSRRAEQLARGKARIAKLRHDRAERAKHEGDISDGRRKFAKLALQAAENYRVRPGDYHYLAGGKANVVFLKPTPRDWRSDCSQFASSVQDAAGLPALGPNGPLWVNTVIMAAHLKETTNPKPGDFGMYGSRNAPHHVETYLGSLGGPGHEFVGHGSPPIDSLTPGRPDFYLENPIAA